MALTDFVITKQRLHDIGGHDVSGSAVYLVQQFCDGELWQSEALAEFSIIIFLRRIPPWQNDAFASLKFLFIAN